MAVKPDKKGNVKGTNNNDTITWISSKDWQRALTVNAGKGNDIINFKKSKYKNTLNGQDGNDVIYGYDGNDSLYGGYGNDVLYGNNNDDSLSDSGRHQMIVIEHVIGILGMSPDLLKFFVIKSSLFVYYLSIYLWMNIRCLMTCNQDWKKT